MMSAAEAPPMAPVDDDISIEEKRVYAGSAGRTDAYVATGTGVVRVALSADKVGAFDMVAREPARDVAVRPGAGASDPDLVGVATGNGLRVAVVDDDPEFVPVDDTSEPGGVGADADTDPPAVAVGVHGDAFLVGRADGRIDRVTVAEPASDGSPPIATTVRIGEVPDPRAIDGPLVAAADGVHRVADADGGGGDPALVPVGLDDARDVAGAGVPLAATGDGLYWLGNGWMAAREAAATAVAGDGGGHAMAVVAGELLVRNGTVGEGPEGTPPGGAGSGSTADDKGRSGSTADDKGRSGITPDEKEESGSTIRSGESVQRWDSDAWVTSTLPVDERPVALGYGPGISVVVTEAGTLCVDAGDGWRHQVVGVRDVGGVALATVE